MARRAWVVWPAVLLLSSAGWLRGPQAATGRSKPAAHRAAAAAAGTPDSGASSASGGSGAAGGAAASPGRKGAGAGGGGQAPAGAPVGDPLPADAWREPLRIYFQFFGLAGTPGPGRAAAVSALLARLAAGPPSGMPGPRRYELQFLVALVPDPLDSQLPAAFDQAIDAIGQSLAHSSPVRGGAWLPDRSWIPWNDPATAQAKRYRSVPGLLLYRRIEWQRPGHPCQLMGVFLVGETPKTGIHLPAFRTALELIAGLSPDGRLPAPVRILGPTYSGSALSLRSALLDWERLHPPSGTAATPAAPATAAASATASALGAPAATTATAATTAAAATTAMNASGAAVSLAPAAPGTGGAAAAAPAGAGGSASGAAAAMTAAGPLCQLDGPSPRFLIVSGTARAPCLEGLLHLDDEAGVRFYRAVVPLDSLLHTALLELHQRMGWDLSRTVLISELDTAYGQSVSTKAPGRCDPEPLPPGVGVARFPSHLAAIRTASEAAGAAPAAAPAAPDAGSIGDSADTSAPPAPAPAAPAPPAAAPANANTSPTWTELPLRLGDQPPGADLIPDFSPLTAPANDLAIGSLVAAINRYDVRYVGILATDVRDTLFLANRIRGLAGNVTLFSVESELLFTHPEVHTALFGTTLISSSPLFTSVAAWRQPTGRHSPPWQFAGSFQNGIYQAAVELLSPCALPAMARNDAGPVWISVVGNGSVWPLGGVDSGIGGRSEGRTVPGGRVEAVLSFDRLTRAEEGPRDPAADPSDSAEPAARDLGAATEASPKGDLELLVFGALLCVGAWWLHKAALLPAPRGRAASEAGTRRLLLAGLAALAVPAAALLVLSALAHWRWRRESAPLSGWTSGQLLCFAGLVIEYGIVLAAIVCAAVLRRRHHANPRHRRFWKAAAVVLGAGTAAVALLGWSVAYLWMPWTAGFDMRLRAIGSGLSPLVSLIWLVAALYVWSLAELERRRLTAWQEIDWPLSEAVAPAFKGCDHLLAAIRWLLTRMLPRSRWRRLLLALPALAAVAVAGWEMQPVAETPAFGKLMLVLWTVPAVLSGISFYRFVRVWQHLRRLLQRIASTPFAERLGELSVELAWKPMQAFTWPIPPFQTLILSHRRLEMLLREDRLALSRDETAQLKRGIEKALALAFEANTGGRGAEEILHRSEVFRFIAQASQGLDPVRSDPVVTDFFAIRIAAYLRYVFAQLRSALISGIVPAFLLLLAVSAYTFEPKGPVTLGLLALLAGQVAVILSIFVAMSRDTVLSLVADNTPGEVTFDSHFIMSVLKFGAVPVLGLVATQVPAAGQLVNTWLRPLLRLAGVE